MATKECDLVGAAEAAEMLGIPVSTLSRWSKRGVLIFEGPRIPFPEPVATLRATPVWRASDLRKLAQRISREQQRMSSD